jgi:adenine C2-methylase RlmN of 23S rRNA A2503 and tRNA A37
LEDLHTILVDGWGCTQIHVKQVWNWIREQGVTDVDEMITASETARSIARFRYPPH